MRGAGRAAVGVAAVLASLSLMGRAGRDTASLAISGALLPVRPAPGAPGPGHVQVLHLIAPGRAFSVRSVWVYRPDVPDSSRLPVLYFLHGVPGAGHDVVDQGILAQLDRSVRQGSMPFVLAAPDGWGEEHGDTEWADSTDGSDLIESFLVDVVVPAVEGSHPRDRSRRAVAGFSMGGYGAMNIALRHPDLFGSVVSVAGYFHVDDPDGVFGGLPEVQAANSPQDHPDRARGLHILLLEDADDSQPAIRGEGARFKQILDGAGVAAELDVRPGNHDWSFVGSQFPSIQDFLGEAWATVSPSLIRHAGR